MKIYAEKLLILDVISKLPFKLSLFNLSVLSKANIEIYFDITLGLDDHGLDDHVCQLMEGICDVKDLTLSDDAIGILSSENRTVKLLSFSNLKILRVDMKGGNEFNGQHLIDLFSCLPNVEYLVVNFGLHEGTFEAYGCWILEPVPHSFLSHLKSVVLSKFEGYEDDLFLVEFLLKNARALEKITIIWSPCLSACPQHRSVTAKRLRKIPGSSLIHFASEETARRSKELNFFGL
ncbi:hypothetical protein AQUCO_04700103v1 [Aquilegia coerulea]|nr:hypothetical protein AQUCO_04700103v1 [Aquilegia coerulea]